MAEDTMQSLESFAAANPDKRPRCLLCRVDADIERQAREGKAAGITYRQIGDWLTSIVGEPVTKGRLERHFQENHNRSDSAPGDHQ
jgi:hypothetical protein